MADQDETSAPAAEAKKLPITIQNLQFEASAPYAAGHAINENEATALNQTRVENLRNNFAGTIKAKLEEISKEDPARTELSAEEIDELKEKFAEYDAEYTFQGKRIGTRAPVDPVAREANKMAKETITAALKAKNIDPKNLVEGRLESLIKEYLDKNPQVTEEAKARVAAVKTLAADALEGIDLTGATKPEAPEAPPAG